MLHRFLLGVFLVAGTWPLAAQAADAAGKAAAKIASLQSAYQGTTNTAEKLKCLHALGPLRNPSVDGFLLQEYSTLDARREPGARLAGAILVLWAEKPTHDLLPYLVYEGLFHDDIEVVRACATGIGQLPEDAKTLMATGKSARGSDSGQELAADLIRRMQERGDAMYSLEKVLVLWSGRKRDGYQPGVSLKRTPKEGEHTAALAFWKGWYEERFRKELK